jgi:ribose 5-phosphate isomerase A
MQVVPRLNASLPVFIDAASWEESAEELDDVFLGDAEIW